jgi:hypothetical protein
LRLRNDPLLLQDFIDALKDLLVLIETALLPVNFHNFSLISAI